MRPMPCLPLAAFNSSVMQAVQACGQFSCQAWTLKLASHWPGRSTHVPAAAAADWQACRAAVAGAQYVLTNVEHLEVTRVFA